MLDPISVLHPENLGPLAINECALATWLRRDVFVRIDFARKEGTDALTPMYVLTFLHWMAPRK